MYNIMRDFRKALIQLTIKSHIHKEMSPAETAKRVNDKYIQQKNNPSEDHRKKRRKKPRYLEQVTRNFRQHWSSETSFLPFFSLFSYAFSLLPQSGQVHLGFKSHKKRTVVRDLQVKPKACERRHIWSHFKIGTVYFRYGFRVICNIPLNFNKTQNTPRRTSPCSVRSPRL